MDAVSEKEIEAQIQDKGLNAPRITPDDISNKIRDIYFHIIPNTTVTVCALTLQNGYVVIGKSAAASKENFDKEIVRNIAYDDARNQIWALEGYLLRERLAK